jgi:hypothetical protein
MAISSLSSPTSDRRTNPRNEPRDTDGRGGDSLTCTFAQ